MDQGQTGWWVSLRIRGLDYGQGHWWLHTHEERGLCLLNKIYREVDRQKYHIIFYFLWVHIVQCVLSRKRSSEALIMVKVVEDCTKTEAFVPSLTQSLDIDPRFSNHASRVRQFTPLWGSLVRQNKVCLWKYVSNTEACIKTNQCLDTGLSCSNNAAYTNSHLHIFLQNI